MRSLAALTLGLATLAAPALAQPANDECINATVVTDGSSPIDNTGANQSVTLPANLLAYNPIAAEYAPVTFSGVDVWYSYTAPATGIRNFEVINNGNSTPASILTIYDACGGAIIASDLAGGVAANAKIRHLAVTAGTTYLIRYAIYGAAGTGAPAALSIADPPTTFATFDDCEMAVPVAGEGPFTISTAGMNSSDSRNWDCDYSRNDGWLAWTPSASGIGVVNGCGLTNATRTKLSAYTTCGIAPFICSGATTIDPPNANCSPKLAFRVTAGQTYIIRIGNSRVTDVTSGNVVFEVRPDNVIMTIPAGAIPESEPCSADVATDVNGGCGHPTDAVTPIQLCNTYTGTATSRRTNTLFAQGLNYFHDVDADVYEFTLDQDDTVTLVGEAEFAPRVSIRVGCGPVVELVNSTTNNAAGKVGGIWDFSQRTGPTGPFVASLVAGTYQLYIAPKGLGANYHDCSADNRYWFRLTGSQPCVPTTERCCRGTTCLDVTAGSCTGTVAGSASVVVGTCTGNTNSGCCYADYDHNGMTEVTDIFGYLNAWFSGSPYADVGGNGTSVPDINDIFTFLNNWFAGCN